MKATSKLDNSFGPAGTTSGIIIFVAGVIMTWFSLTGLILVLPGSFLGFTSTFVTIDFDNKRVKFFTLLCGIIPVGKWMSIDPGMKLGIRKNTRLWKTYSRSNRSLETKECDIRLLLFDKDGKVIFALKKYKDVDSAKSDLVSFSQTLGLYGGKISEASK